MLNRNHALRSLCAAAMAFILAIPAPVQAIAADDTIVLAGGTEAYSDMIDISAENEDAKPSSDETNAETSKIQELLSQTQEQQSLDETEAQADDEDITAETEFSGNEVEKPAFDDTNIQVVPPETKYYYNGSEYRPAASYKLYDIRNKDNKVELDASEYEVEYDAEDNYIDPGYHLITFKSTNKSFASGSLYEFFRIQYDLKELKKANTQESLTSVSGNILVKNSDPKFKIYAYVIAEDSVASIKAGQDELVGVEIEPTKDVKISTAYVWDKGAVRKKNLEEGIKYSVYASLYEEMYYAADEEDYLVLETVQIRAAKEEPSGDYLNGEQIKLTATVQKGQDVKIAWAPDKKAYPDYAAYELYVYKNGNFDTKLWPSAANPNKSKSCTIKAANAADLKSGLVMLKCFDKAGACKAQYLAAVAPYLFEVQGGDKDGERQFTFSDLKSDMNMSFELQAAIKENKDPKYTDDLKCVVPSEACEAVSYAVSAKKSESAFKTSYYVDKEKLTKDTKYFFRIKSKYLYKGMELISAPSNAIGMNVGPAKCVIEMIVGEDPQKMIDNLSASDAEDLYNGVHADSIGTCYKKGYVLFYCPEKANDASVISSIELLKSNERYGVFKSIKKYAPKLVKKIDTSKYLEALKAAGIEISDADYYDHLYYVEYNNFPPEESWYYKVRAISKKKSVGGASEAYENTTYYEQVQDFIALDSGTNTVEMYWKHDDCAKQYWIYRYENPDPTKVVDYATELKRATDAKPLYTVKGTSFKKTKMEDNTEYRWHTFTDKKVENGKEYYYMIRPVYNTKTKASYDDFEYSVRIYTDTDWTGEYKPADSPMGVIPTAMGKAPKSVKAEAYNMLQPTIHWSAVKDDGKNKIIGYRIQRTPADKFKQNDPESASWTTVVNVFKDSPEKEIKNAFSKRAYRDTGIASVGPYQYRVCGLYSKTAPETGYDGKTGYAYVRFDTKPLPVGNLSLSKQNGSDFRYGANVKFTIDKKDMEALRDHPEIKLHYLLEYSDDNTYWTELISGDVNVNQASYSTRDYNDGFDLRRGVKRRYRVTLTNNGYDEKGSMYLSQKQSTFQKPTEIELAGHDPLVAGGDTVSLEIKYNGTVCELDCAPETSNSSVVKIDSWDNGHVVIKPVGAGEAKIKVKAYRCGWGGGKLTREVTIKVIPRTTK